ncbi:hypothetical protein ANN_11937 [Periplaneta americana]|uniref:Tc1-like transposase DDE domain-containing protein n=1 Tax=Periplaneta americana TaxID=6978 RepID=A0ABQ8T7J9_PERAM|nr:hypothetical protein ANN_11937 [Periplaneta americana]
MIPGSNTESYPAFARIGLRENPGKNLNQITCTDRDSNPGHLVSQPDALTVTPQSKQGKEKQAGLTARVTEKIEHPTVLSGDMKKALVDRSLLSNEALTWERRSYCNERIVVETLRRLWDAVRRKRPEKWVENNWFLMHDNAPAHRAIIVKNFLARHNITALDHPPYSPDLSPPDYFLFPRLKSHLKGRRFNAEEVIANATRALRRVSQNGFQACFQELYALAKVCFAEGNYFEGNAVE